MDANTRRSALSYTIVLGWGAILATVALLGTSAFNALLERRNATCAGGADGVPDEWSYTLVPLGQRCDIGETGVSDVNWILTLILVFAWVVILVALIVGVYALASSRASRSSKLTARAFVVGLVVALTTGLIVAAIASYAGYGSSTGLGPGAVLLGTVAAALAFVITTLLTVVVGARRLRTGRPTT